MPSSKSSVDNRDVYYRLGKSAGYRARSAYKLLHLDEEFGLFKGVKTAVDLCAAPGSWSQVLGQELKPSKGADANKVVSVDLQPMAPLPNITILQTDITLPSTVPLVLDALGGRKADLVVCDGAPDVTGVHDLDAYLHSQLLLAALTLSLTLLAPGATLIFKIFLSPLDPQAAMLRSQLESFFPAQSFQHGFAEFDYSDSGNVVKINPEAGGVWVRKPRSSRKGSGEAFIVCRNFDPSTVPLPIHFPPEALVELAAQTTGTLTLDSIAGLAGGVVQSNAWEAIKAYVGSGDLDAGVLYSSHKRPGKPEMTLSINTDGVSRNSSVKSIRALHPQPTPCEEPDEYFAAQLLDERVGLKQLHLTTRDRAASLTTDRSNRCDSQDNSTKPEPSSSPVFVTQALPWDRNTSPLPTPRKGSTPDGLLSTREWDIVRTTPREDGAVSPALSSGSKTDLFFASAQTESLPTPPKPMSKGMHMGRGLPDGIRGHDRTVSMPIMRPGNDVELLVSPRTHLDPIRRIDFTSSARIFNNDMPSSPLNTLPTFSAGMKSIPPPVRLAHTRRDSQQLSRETREVPVDAAPLRVGTILRPTKDDRRWLVDSERQWRLLSPLGEGAFSSVWSAEELEAPKSTVAAIKLTSRATCATNARTRIAFLREVSVLRHLSHPAIVTFLGSFSTASHHCLVLEQLSGGELFDLINADENYDRLLLPGPDDQDGEGIVRRMFGELCRGVGWLHEVGVVHRDIKLENILFTVNPFTLPPTSTGSIPLNLLPSPLVKLTDFGLSRFINPASPVLQTRCGSESFAAPEIIMGKPYDGRETDAWAMGVVLYALVVGELPFDVEEEGLEEKGQRKRKMMRIAKGEYSWRTGIGSPGVRTVVSKFLVRDPKKRRRVSEIWDQDWMKGPGEVSLPGEICTVQGVGANTGKGRKVLDGFLLDEEVEDEAQAEAV